MWRMYSYFHHIHSKNRGKYKNVKTFIKCTSENEETSQEWMWHLLIIVHYARPTQDSCTKTWQYPDTHTCSNSWIMGVRWPSLPLDHFMAYLVVISHAWPEILQWLLFCLSENLWESMQMCFRIQTDLPRHLSITLNTTMSMYPSILPGLLY
jgi:hypothetical protein